MPQQQVNRYLAEGVPGAKATLNPFTYHPNTLRAEGDAVAVGAFVWPGTDPESQGLNSTTGPAAPIGLVERVLAYPNYNLVEEGSLTLPEGAALTVGVRGDYWVVTATAAAAGQKAFANTADGSVSTAAAGAAVSGHVETEWEVKTSGAAGDLIIISRS